MHSCPDCGQACDCDGEDTWIEENEEECIHECDPEEDYMDDWEDEEPARCSCGANAEDPGYLHFAGLLWGEDGN